MAEKEYIERDVALEIVKRTSGDYATAFSEIARISAADVAPVVHARWITEDNTEGYTGDPRCTACKGLLDGEAVYGYTPGVDSFFYCPNCGAKMDGATDNNVGGNRKERDNA